MSYIDRYNALRKVRHVRHGAGGFNGFNAPDSDAVIRLLAEALRTYGGHEDDCAGMAGYLDPRCTCGLSALLAAIERDFKCPNV